MTQDQLEEYLTRLLPGFHIQYADTADEHDLVQRTVIDLYKKHKALVITSDKEFLAFFLRYYRTWQFRRRATIARCLEYGDYLHEFMSYSGQYAEEAQDLSDSLYSPWDTPKIQALEYIELVGNPLLKQVMRWYYIEGYTTEEIATGLQRPIVTVHFMLKDGIQRIKDWITEGTENKPDPP
jgi:DNA-directed RNA polymerase specialized sigma24 family protein